MDRQRIKRAGLIVAMVLFPVVFYYLSPVIVLNGAFFGIVTGSLVFFSLLFLFSMTLGRAWCAWGCPAAGIQDELARVRGKPTKGGWRNLVKWFIWMPWIGLIVALFYGAGGVRAVDPLYMTWHGISVTEMNGLVVFVMVTVSISVISLVGGRRSFCHSVCWMAPFMVLGTRLGATLGLPRLHLEADEGRCIGCGKCRKACPMSLDIPAMVTSGTMDDHECILCATCVDTCPKGVIDLRVGARGWRSTDDLKEDMVIPAEAVTKTP